MITIKGTMFYRPLTILIGDETQSEEPGVFFVDRYNQESNSAYYNKIQCTNPCITGDTLIGTIGGERPNRKTIPIPIKDLADCGKDIDVWCWEIDKKTGKSEAFVRVGRNPRKTGEKEEVWKVTVKSGDSIKVTPNHKFIRKNGEEVFVRDLKSGDVLFPYFKEDHIPTNIVDKVEFFGYEDVYNITVDDFHNYAIILDPMRGAGIVVKNCGETRVIKEK